MQDNKPLILVAEDDAETRQALTEWIHTKDFAVIAVSNGMDALKVIANSKSPIIAILDWDMPKMSGVEILAHTAVIEHLHPDKFIYIILVSGKYTEPEWSALGVDLGAKIFLGKPIDLEILDGFIGAAERAIQKAERRKAEASDDLTGFLRQTKGKERLQEELARAERNDKSVSCLFMDLDHFKDVNDRYGHQTGTDLIKYAADRIAEHKRSYDVAIRYGGDEFCLILPDSSEGEAKEIALRIWDSISNHPFVVGKKKISVTSSIGVAVSFPGITAQELLERADKALYQAKANGRNGVFVFGNGLKKNIRGSG